MEKGVLDVSHKLDFSLQVSRVFVGGIPTDVDVNENIQTTSYVGKMEEVIINEHDIGLWNFLNAGTSNIRNRGAVERYSFYRLIYFIQ